MDNANALRSSEFRFEKHRAMTLHSHGGSRPHPDCTPEGIEGRDSVNLPAHCAGTRLAAALPNAMACVRELLAEFANANALHSSAFVSEFARPEGAYEFELPSNIAFDAKRRA